MLQLSGRHIAKVFSYPLWEIRSFNDRRITMTHTARALVMRFAPSLEQHSISSRVWSVICSLFLSRPCEAPHKISESRLRTFVYQYYSSWEPRWY